MFVRYVCLVLVTLSLCSCKTDSSELLINKGVTAGKYYKNTVQIEMKKDGGKSGGHCTASVVSDNTLLLAAHCVVGWERIVYTYGDEDSKQVLQVSSTELYYHPSYKLVLKGENDTAVNDLAVAVFPDGTFSQIVPVVIGSSFSEGEVVRLVGYGCVNKTNKDLRYKPRQSLTCKTSLSKGRKYTASNKIVKQDRCPQGMIEVNDKEWYDGAWEKGADEGVYPDQFGTIEPGDSGGPLFIEDVFTQNSGPVSLNNSIPAVQIGVASTSIINRDYISYDYSSSCYTDLTLESNIKFLKDVIQQGQARIRGW